MEVCVVLSDRVRPVCRMTTGALSLSRNRNPHAFPAPSKINSPPSHFAGVEPQKKTNLHKFTSKNLFVYIRCCRANMCHVMYVPVFCTGSRFSVHVDGDRTVNQRGGNTPVKFSQHRSTLGCLFQTLCSEQVGQRQCRYRRTS